MRGAGATGLGGIYPRREALIRPFLDVSRQELRAFLSARGESWVEDETNAGLDQARNRVRHQVLPEFDRAAGGPTGPAIARAAGLIRDDAQWLDALAEQRLAELCTSTGAGTTGPGNSPGGPELRLEFVAASLAAEPLPIRRRLLLRALRLAARDREIGLNHVEMALGVLSGACSAADIPGVRVELRREKLLLLQQGDASKC
jgi:tRNA(Ile)-lysidine synthase